MTNENDKNRKRLGDKLRKARERAHLTQVEVAAKAGVNDSYYAQIERGEVNVSFDKLQSIVKVLKIKSLDLL